MESLERGEPKESVQCLKGFSVCFMGRCDVERGSWLFACVSSQCPGGPPGLLRLGARAGQGPGGDWGLEGWRRTTDAGLSRRST